MLGKRGCNGVWGPFISPRLRGSEARWNKRDREKKRKESRPKNGILEKVILDHS